MEGLVRDNKLCVKVSQKLHLLSFQNICLMAPANDTHIKNFFVIYGSLDQWNDEPGFDNYFDEYITQIWVTSQQVIMSIVRHDAEDVFNKFLPDTFFYMMDPHSHIFDWSITINNIPINDIIF